MTRAQRIETIKFLEQLKKDLLIQVLKDMSNGHNDNKDKWTIINDLNKQLYVEKAKVR